MNTYTRNEIKKMAEQTADVEIYRFTQADRYIRGIHTDNTVGMDMTVDELPDEFKGIVQMMDEDEYENTLLANSCMSADFEDCHGDKYAKVLVVVLSYDSVESC